MGGLIGFWREQTLLRRFVFAGGVVMLAAMLLVGTWVTGRIERAVIGNTAAATALYMESFISPLSQELARENSLSEPANRALTEVFSGTPLGQRIVSYKIWKPGGYVVAASDPGIVGKTLTPSGAQRAAWRGEVTANFEGLHEAENAPEAAMGLPLLEIYSPVREVWTGDVIAVVEFYAVEDTLISDVARARRQSWLFIAAVFAGCGLLLVGIVRGGGRTIERQKAMLREEARRSNAIAAQNAELRQRAVGAAARAAAQTERTLRRASADLHDGPAQYLALAALRLERIVPDTEAGQVEARAIRDAIATALGEIRAISRGLSLPDLDRAPLRDVVARAIETHQRHSESAIAWSYEGAADPGVDQSAKICVYRFIQEALSNASRHAPRAAVRIAASVAGGAVAVSVSDDGPGFDISAPAEPRTDGGQGLAGLRDRAESIGGDFQIESVASGSAGRGTVLRLRLPLTQGGET